MQQQYDRSRSTSINISIGCNNNYFIGVERSPANIKVLFILFSSFHANYGSQR